MEEQKGVIKTATIILIAAFIAELTAAAVIDVITMTIPNILNIIIAATGIIYGILFPPFYVHLLGACAAGVPMLILSMHSGMGGGDLKLSVAAGIFIGGYKPLLSITAAFLLGGITAIAMLLVKCNYKKHIPFAPFLSAGFIISLFVGGI